MIKAEIEDKSPKTQEYIKYILTRFAERFPLSEKELVELDIAETKTPFPKIKEVSDSHPVEKVIPEDADMVKIRVAERARAMDEYMTERFTGLCTISSPDGWHGTWLRAKLKFFVIDPEKIYSECKKYGVEIENEDNILKDANPSVAKFYNDPPRIVWNGAIVPIKYNSLQQDISKFAFQKSVKESIPWDEVAKNTDSILRDDIQKGIRSIRYAVWRLNSSIKKKCGKPLFVWQDKSFYRVS